jgi:hypothetical protein
MTYSNRYSGSSGPLEAGMRQTLGLGADPLMPPGLRTSAGGAIAISSRGCRAKLPIARQSIISTRTCYAGAPGYAAVGRADDPPGPCRWMPRRSAGGRQSSFSFVEFVVIVMPCLPVRHPPP